jgi:hypothetical protein
MDDSLSIHPPGLPQARLGHEVNDCAGPTLTHLEARVIAFFLGVTAAPSLGHEVG